MTWDLISAAGIFLALVAWALWGLTGPHKLLPEKDGPAIKDGEEI